MWRLTIEQTTKKEYEGRKFDSKEQVILKAYDADKLFMITSALAAGFPDENISYTVEREVEE